MAARFDGCDYYVGRCFAGKIDVVVRLADVFVCRKGGFHMPGLVHRTDKESVVGRAAEDRVIVYGTCRIVIQNVRSSECPALRF